MYVLRYVWVLLILVSCIGAKNSEVKTTSGSSISASAPYVWNSNRFPLTIVYSDEFMGDGDYGGAVPAINEIEASTLMMTAWHTALNNQLQVFTVGGAIVDKTNASVQVFNQGQINEYCTTNLNLSSLLDNEHGIYRTRCWPTSLSGSALAVAQLFGIRYNAGEPNEYVEISHADILVNYNMYEFTSIHEPGKYDLPTVVLHELGHFMGLQHSPSTMNRDDSVMYPRIRSCNAQSCEVKRVPTAYDIENLAANYSVNLPLMAENGEALQINSALSAITENINFSEDPEAGEQVLIHMELMSDGDCVHKENGKIVHTHQVKLN